MHLQSTTDPTFQQRFFARMTRTPSGCLEWQGCTNLKGYGQVRCNGTMQGTHRVAWIIVNGPIPDGLDVLHKCDNRTCCDVDHLFLGTDLDNNHDMIFKGRAVHVHGEQHGHAKLTETDVLEIRRIYVCGSHEFGQSALARRFDVDHAHIGRIIRRKKWNHI